MQHAGQLHVDAEQRLAFDDRGVVDAADPGAQQGVGGRVFQYYQLGVGQWQRGGGGRQRPEAQLAAAGRVFDRAVGGAAFGGRHPPGLGGGLDQHGAGGRAEAVEIVVVGGRRGRAAGALAAVSGVEVALDDAHVLPVHLEFLGNDHRQRGLDALADFRLL